MCFYCLGDWHEVVVGCSEKMREVNKGVCMKEKKLDKQVSQSRETSECFISSFWYFDKKPGKYLGISVHFRWIFCSLVNEWKIFSKVLCNT